MDATTEALIKALRTDAQSLRHYAMSPGMSAQTRAKWTAEAASMEATADRLSA